MNALAPRRIEAISVDECLGLLGTRSVGRVGFIDGDAPQILPVNYQFHEGEIVFRTDYGRLLAAIDRTAAVFEVDAIDPDYRTGWSVVVEGKAEEVWKPAELTPLRRLPLRPWAPGGREHYVRIRPRSISGRRIS